MTLLELDLIPMSGIPGVLNIGPAFKISAEADAVLSANVDLSVDIDFGLVDAKVYFPNSTGLSGQFNKLDSSGKCPVITPTTLLRTDGRLRSPTLRESERLERPPHPISRCARNRPLPASGER